MVRLGLGRRAAHAGIVVIRGTSLVRRLTAAFPLKVHAGADRQTTHAFSVPFGFSTARSPLTLVLVPVALLACSTAAFGPLLASAWLDADKDVPPFELASTPDPTARREARPQPPIISEPIPVQLIPVRKIPGESSPAGPDPARSSAAQPSAAPSPTVAAPSTVALEKPSEPPSESLKVTGVPVPAETPETDQEPVNAADLAAAPQIPAEPPEERSSDGPLAGIWGPNEKACSPQLGRNGYLLAVINGEGAWAGETTCAFKTSKRSGNSWIFGAVCSDTRRRWHANVRVSVVGDRLTWTSQRGSRTYVRCSRPELLRADGTAKPAPRV
jgi:hypothetical protein